jgi:hypothetical protein
VSPAQEAGSYVAAHAGLGAVVVLENGEVEHFGDLDFTPHQTQLEVSSR